MNPSSAIARAALAAFVLGSAGVTLASEPTAPRASSRVFVPAPQAIPDDDLPAPPGLPRAHPPLLAAGAGATGDSTITARFRWPVLAQDFQHVFNYVDLDGASGILDWNCLASTYDTHQGTDIMIRDFVEMDEGRFFVAAAAGEIVWVEDGYFDRAAFPGNGGPNNFVYMRHDDGSYGLYLHHRKWSSLVGAGERVFEGQALGLIGSSGNSSDPHVHFEVADASESFQDPFSGPCRLDDSLWKDPQPPHIATSPIAVYSHGLSSTVPDIYTIKERAPALRRVQQGAGVVVYFWYRMTGISPGDVSRVVYRQPGGGVYSDDSYTHPDESAYDWIYWQTFLPEAGSTGTWTIELSLNGQLALTHTFDYGAAPYADPVADAQSIAVAKGRAAGVLSGSDADSGIHRFELVSPPAHGGVALEGPRASRFRYVAASGYSGNDSFTVRAVDGEGRASAPATISLAVSPVLANALFVAGEDDTEFVEIPANAALDTPGNAFTAEVWLRPGIGSNQWQDVLDRRETGLSDDHGVSLSLRPDQLVQFLLGQGTGPGWCYSLTKLPLREWTHVAVSYDGEYQRIFVDGVLDNFCYLPGAISWSGTGALRIGGSFGPFASYRGSIDEVRWWAEARDASEIAAGARCGFYSSPLPATLRGNWRFDGDALDASANALHGVLLGGAGFVNTDGGVPVACAGIDRDGDGVQDGADLCPLVADPAQADTDDDGIGDACDICPARRDPAQVDADGDGVGDACDACLFVGDTRQDDADGDGIGDACDSAPASASEGVPGDAISLQVEHDAGGGITTLTWSAAARAARYEVYRGSLEMVRAGFYGTCISADDPDPSDTLFAESAAPAPGESFFYLVLAANAQGERGGAGVDGAGRARDLRARDCR